MAIFSPSSLILLSLANLNAPLDAGLNTGAPRVLTVKNRDTGGSRASGDSFVFSPLSRSHFTPLGPETLKNKGGLRGHIIQQKSLRERELKVLKYIRAIKVCLGFT